MRINASLGVASVDLSGMMGPTPRPGGPITKLQCRYFLVLTIRPEISSSSDACVGTDPKQQEAEPEEASGNQHAAEPEEAVGDLATEKMKGKKEPRDKPLGPLIYAALLTSKDEAGPEIQRLLAQDRYEHGSMPREIVFRIHSDRQRVRERRLR